MIRTARMADVKDIHALINSSAVRTPDLIGEVAKRFGSQCIVVAIDVKTEANGLRQVYINGGRVPTGLDAVAWAREAQDRGAGEILLTSMDRDGTKDGFDVPLTRAVDIRSTRLGASHPETIASRKALTQASEATQPAPASTVPTAEKPRKSKKDEFEELIEPGRDWEWRWRNFLNFVDDYYDDAKHEVHGRKIGESRFFLPRWLMLGSGNPCK